MNLTLSLARTSRASFVFVAAIVIVAGCTKSTEYKRSRIITTSTPLPGNSTPPPDPQPEPEPIPQPGLNYLALPKSDAKFVYKDDDVLIENLRFENINGISIYIKQSKNVTIRNCFFNRASAEAINIEHSSNILIENCLFNRADAGVYAMESQNIKVINNQFVNVRQRAGEGRGQFVQFNGVTGPGNVIENNQGENFPGESDPEDLISLFKSYGTAASPILIRNNTFRGGGPSSSGGGIMTGDYGGAFIIVEDNVLVDPGQYGIASAGGYDISILNNKIYGKRQPFTNNPLYVWGQTGVSCYNINVKGNRVNWIDRNGYNNRGWNAGNCGNTAFEYGLPITLEEMNVPAHLITKVTPAQLIEIRQ
jgi:parallel beta-helix repeat protein